MVGQVTNVQYANPQARIDLPHTTQQMQQALSFIYPFRPDVTSVSHGEHVKDSAHYQGRAVDVGAFNGVSVGYNAQTWQAITTAIASGQFEKIGTTWKLAQNPQLVKFAHDHGVELFVDEGSGPHVHFQVAAGQQ